MVQISTSEIGQRFFQYYQNHGFDLLPRGSLVNAALPMTFVGSAGFSQIKSAIEYGDDRTVRLRGVSVETLVNAWLTEKVVQLSEQAVS